MSGAGERERLSKVVSRDRDNSILPVSGRGCKAGNPDDLWRIGENVRNLSFLGYRQNNLYVLRKEPGNVKI